MPDIIDKEINAIKTVLKALEPLDPKARQSVLEYVLKRLDIKVEAFQKPPPGETPVMDENEQPAEVHIKNLKKEKKPRSAIEMATLVAYYLANKAPKEARKQTITTEDIDTYFKIAEFKLPTQPKFTLPNTKNAGYLDAIGGGEYKLNPVGYNLVVHSMPKSKKGPSSKISKPKKAKKKTKKKAKKKAKKKTSNKR